MVPEPDIPENSTRRQRGAELAQSMALQTGIQLGPYKIVAPLGKGGMGEVYRARDTRLDREVAIKVLPEHLVESMDSLNRFQREAKALAALSHPNIVSIFDVGVEREIFFVVMELLDGETLRSRLSHGCLSWEKSLEIAVPVVEGLTAAHSKGIIHRDLKPENIFFTSNGAVKILDFGLARKALTAAISDLTSAPTASHAETESGMIRGTIPYMAPEQVRGEHVDARTDIFAFGCVLYEMLAGRRPFQQATAAETAAAILRDEPPRLAENVPAELEEIMMRCLEKNPDQRFQTARDLAFDLKRVHSHSGTRASVPTGQLTGRNLRPTILTRIAAFAIIALAVLIAGYLILSQRKQAAIEPGQIRSIAVLPLKNLSGDPKQEYFSDGMTEELIATLARIESLRVISRTSVSEYKQTTKKIPQIAKELNVDAVVEGSVLQAGDRVRITAQLIQASTDRHLWAESYERDLRDIFALQNEVARSIAQEIRIKLTPQEQARLASAPRVDPGAFQAYLRGRQYLNSVDFTEDTQRLGIAMFERAVELDPSFALAYAGLTVADSRFYHLYDRANDRLEKAKAAVDRAFEIQPGLPEAHLALGYYYYYGFKDYNRALQELSTAQQRIPNDVLLIDVVAAIRRRMGNFQGAIDGWKNLLELSPRDAKAARDVGVTYMVMRQHSEAHRYFDLSITLAPDQLYCHVLKSTNYLLWKGDALSAKDALDRAPMKTDTSYTLQALRVEMDQRNYPAVLERLSTTSHEFFQSDAWFTPKTLLTGVTYQMMNKPELAYSSFDAARKLLEQKAKDQPDDFRFHSSLGIAYAGLGRKDEAIREGKLAVDLLPVSKDAHGGPHRVIDLAVIYTMVGELDAALDQIEYLLSIPCYFSVPLLKLDPRWDPLRSHPRYQNILQKYERELNP